MGYATLLIMLVAGTEPFGLSVRTTLKGAGGGRALQETGGFAIIVSTQPISALATSSLNAEVT